MLSFDKRHIFAQFVAKRKKECYNEEETTKSRKRGTKNEEDSWNRLQHYNGIFLRAHFPVFVLFWLFLFDADRLDGTILGCDFLFFILCIDDTHTPLLHFGYCSLCQETQKRTARRLVSGAVFSLDNHRAGTHFDVYPHVLKH